MLTLARTEADDNARPPTNYEINLGEFLDRAGLKGKSNES